MYTSLSYPYMSFYIYPICTCIYICTWGTTLHIRSKGWHCSWTRGCSLKSIIVPTTIFCNNCSIFQPDRMILYVRSRISSGAFSRPSSDKYKCLKITITWTPGLTTSRLLARKSRKFWDLNKFQLLEECSFGNIYLYFCANDIFCRDNGIKLSE